jgi:hypothetical protein
MHGLLSTRNPAGTPCKKGRYEREKRLTDAKSGLKEVSRDSTLRFAVFLQGALGARVTGNVFHAGQRGRVCRETFG